MHKKESYCVLLLVPSTCQSRRYGVVPSTYIHYTLSIFFLFYQNFSFYTDNIKLKL